MYLLYAYAYEAYFIHPGKALAQMHMHRWQLYPYDKRASRTIRHFKVLTMHALCTTSLCTADFLLPHTPIQALYFNLIV